MTKKKIFITGGAGYIGAHVVYRLRQEKRYALTIYDNLSSGSPKNIFADTKFIKGDILNYQRLQKALAGGYDAVMHFAAKKSVAESMCDPNLYAENNITGTLNILKAMAVNGVKKIIFSSSAAVYGHPRKLPITENNELQPENFYGFTKLEIERILAWLEKLGKIKYASLRYFNAAGYEISSAIKGLEKDPQNLLPVIMEVAIGKRKRLKIFGDDYPTRDGTCIRDYIHVMDLAEAHVQALRYLDKQSKLVVNLGSEKGHTVREVLDQARQVTGKKIPAIVVKRRPGDPPALYASSRRARKLIGYRPKYSDLNTIIKSMWQVYRDN